MPPLRAKMIHDRELQRLAPRTQEASVAAVAGIATFSHCSPDRLGPEQICSSLPHLLVERHLAWSSCHHVACGLTFFSTSALGWHAVHLDLLPRTGRPPFPHGLSLEELQRLFTSARTLTHRALLMTTSAAGLRVSEVVRLQRTDLERDRMVLRVNQGKGHKDRSTLLAPRLLSAWRASGKRSRPSPWLCTAQTPTTPMAIATAQQISSHAQRAAGITHGKGLHTLRHRFATHRREAGVDVRTIHLLLGHTALDTTTRSLHLTRHHLAKIRRPFDRLRCGDLALPTVEYRFASAPTRRCVGRGEG